MTKKYISCPDGGFFSVKMIQGAAICQCPEHHAVILIFEDWTHCVVMENESLARSFLAGVRQAKGLPPVVDPSKIFGSPSFRETRSNGSK